MADAATEAQQASSPAYRPYEGMRAVLYARVSTNDKGQTNETQIRAMREWCETNGVKIVDIYRDEESGTTLLRDEFSKMIVHILTPPYEVDMLLAYDQSRLTRDKKLEDIMRMVEPSGCLVRFVRMDLDPTTFEGDLVNALLERVDKRENDVRRDKTRQGMMTRKSNGKHVGRPARFMFSEDIESAPKGRFQAPDPERGVRGTITATEQYIYSFAREGKSLYYVAHTVLGIDHHTLINEMKARPADAGKSARRAFYADAAPQGEEADKKEDAVASILAGTAVPGDGEPDDPEESFEAIRRALEEAADGKHSGAGKQHEHN